MTDIGTVAKSDNMLGEGSSASDDQMTLTESAESEIVDKGGLPCQFSSSMLLIEVFLYDEPFLPNALLFNLAITLNF